MAQNYTKMWDAFLGGEWEDGTEVTEGNYKTQTEQFYQNIIGPAFGLDETFGTTDLEGTYAQFSNVEFEKAERDFRSAIGDPYGGGAGDPFSWEKVSRYNTGDPAGVGRVQDLLADQLYGQGKFLGGEAGADYGTATSKELETYTTGMTGEREELTYGALTSGASLASGTSGATIRSGEGMAVAEDVLIEAYKKAKTLGADYRAGSELIERDLEEDLNDALTTYLNTIDMEKERWFSDVLRNVDTYKILEMEAGLTEEEKEALDPYETMTDADMELEFGGEEGVDYYNQWSCGYGQTWDGEKCVDTKGEGGYEEEVAGYKFRDDAACGIGELWQDNGDGTGECVVRDDLDLELDDYGYLCDQVQECWDGSMVCDMADCGEEPVEDPVEEEKISCLMSGPNTCPPGMRCDDGQCIGDREEEDDVEKDPRDWNLPENWNFKDRIWDYLKWDKRTGDGETEDERDDWRDMWFKKRREFS